MKPDTVLVVPAFNEERRLDLAAFKAFAPRADGVRVLFVDDGSTDATAGLARTLADEFPPVFELLRLEANKGKAEAVRAGLLQALDSGARYAGYWDADLATPLESVFEFRSLLETRPSLDLVLGSRVRLLGRHIERSELRHYVGRLFATAASLALRLPVYDTQCGAKLLRCGPRLKAALAEPFASRWIFDVELLARLGERRAAAGLGGLEEGAFELALSHWKDPGGSKLGAADALRSGWELACLAWRLRAGRA